MKIKNSDLERLIKESIENEMPRVYSQKALKEDKLNIFGKHPGYRKKPMTVNNTSETPFGTKIGDSAPFDKAVNILTDQIVKELKESLKKKDYKIKRPAVALSERKVLKVSSQKEDFNDIPDDNVDNQVPTESLPVDDIDNMNPNSSENQPEEEKNNDFDRDFDAGIDVDEDEDPKKYIQKLTGKLSQKLNSFNQNNEDADEELNKYVAGMIISQTSKVLDDDSKKELIQKINANNDDKEKNNDEENDNTEEFQNENKIYSLKEFRNIIEPKTIK